MTTLINNKTFKRFLGIALTILLVVTLMPQVQPAYGDGETTTAPEETTFTEEPSDVGAGSASNDDLETSFDAEAPTVERPVAKGTADAVGYVLSTRNASSTVIEADETREGMFTYSDSGDYLLEINGCLEGNIVVSGGARLTLRGTGVIDGKGTHGTIIHVNGGGSTLVIEGSLTITGGAHGTQLNDVDGFEGYYAGGGILVQRDTAGQGASLVFRNGTVTNNTAGAGGGIFIDRSCSFTMEDGSVTYNTATTHEGGGIYVAGGTKLQDGKWVYDGGCAIDRGEISHNNTKTKVDWGGGGIFVESKGFLRLASSLITQNDARGLGGGISGCPHASIGIGKIEEGFALYGNTAHKAYWPDNTYLDKLQVSYNGKTYDAGDKWAKADTGFTADKAQDFYCTNVSYVSGYGDRAITWEGRATGSSAFGTTARDITIRNGESLVLPGESLGLTNTKPASEKVTGRAVTIEDNKSTTHGGGIGCNGTILIGDVGQGDQYNPLSLTIKKEFENSDGDIVPLQGGEFAFQLKDGNAVLAEASNDAGGNVTFIVDDPKVQGLLGAAGKTKTSTLTIEEVAGTNSAIDYAGPVTVKLSVRHDEQRIQYPNSTIDVTYHTPVITQIKVDGKKVDNGAITMGNVVNLAPIIRHEPVSLEIQKNLVSSLGDSLSLKDRTYTFELSGIDGHVIVPGNADGSAAIEAKTDASGRVVFEQIDISSYLPVRDPETWDGETAIKVELVLKEIVPEEQGNVAYDGETHRVTFEIRPTAQKVVDNAAATKTITVTPNLVEGSLEIDGTPVADRPIVNTLNVRGSWQPTATKQYYGVVSAETSFSFSVTEIAPVEDIAQVKLEGGSLVSSGVASDFGGGIASSVDFEKIEYTDTGDHWYVMREAGGQDPTVYVFHVEVTKSEDKESLVATVKNSYYAPSMSATSLTPLEDAAAPAQFYNSDTAMAFSLYGYGVNAMSGEPVEQQCLVDPKVIKQLDGRAIKADEFRFKLIQVMEKDDWSNTSGPEISATTNDEFGMVDFDKANNLAADGLDPCCLLFTAPGTYQYRVIEDTDYRKDPSIAYSDQVITFTAVIELDQATGQLICTDMFYGYLNDQGQNVRYKDQYTGWENKDENWVPTAADFPLLNMDWHPTITNKAKPMDLKVRKTSVLDRNEGLEGATYGLYMVNEAEQGDVLLASATSDDEGWIYFEDVNLNAGALYYFKEQAAPAGHTVSEFRSPYFYVEVSTDEATGFATYTMKYTDTKLAMAAAEGTGTEEVALGRLAVEAPEASEDASGESAPAPVDEEASGASEGSAGEGSTGAAEPTPVTESHPEYTDDGALLFTYEYEGGVFDEATLVEFNKLDTRTHEWVEGAELSIVEKDSGQVVTSWVSGAAPERLEKLLNVGVTYVLREDKAPENYQKANDVEFVIDDYGNVEILSGTDNGNAELRDSTIILYDTMFDAEEVITRERETVREVPQTGKTVDNLAKTGDWLPLTGLGLLAVAALGVAIAALRRSRKAGK